jgi:hypothetical protein
MMDIIVESKQQSVKATMKDDQRSQSPEAAQTQKS